MNMSDNEYKFLKLIGFSSGNWIVNINDALNFSGTYVKYVESNNNSIFQSRHDSKIFSNSICINDSNLVSKAPKLFFIVFEYCLYNEELNKDNIKLLESICSKSWEEMKEIYYSL